MAVSGRGINYSLRPAKSIERKIICELLNKIKNIFNIEKYRYIGFGSFYYTDYILFHKEFNIKKMISMERDILHKERYEFNKPYSCIENKFGESTNLLSKDIEWDGATKDIVWLDYDKTLQESYIDDLQTCIKNVTSGSVVIISFNSTLEIDKHDSRINSIKKCCDSLYLPDNIREKDLDPAVVHKIFHKIIEAAAKKALKDKNTMYREDCDKYQIKQITFLKYRDGAPMLSIAYILVKNSDINKYEECNLNDLDIYCTKDEPFKIEVPNFTNKELQLINSYLPNKSVEDINKQLNYIPLNDIKKYMKIYRYFPNYMEVY